MNMIVVLSPAKQLNFSIMRTCLTPTIPQFITQAENIVSGTLAPQSKVQLSKTLKISGNLAKLNAERYSKFAIDTNRPSKHIHDVAACAVTAYTGRAWQGLDQKTLSDDELTYCNKTLRIISGLYGLLKPSDVIQPYRLDMGTKVQVDEHKNLYSYWGEQLKNSLLAENPSVIVNVASNEYWKACLEKQLSRKTRVVTISFREGQGSSARVLAVHAKLARGKFVRFMCQTKPKNIEALQNFTSCGYVFDVKQSNDKLMVFTRSSSSRGSSSNSNSNSNNKPGKKRNGIHSATEVGSAKKRQKIKKKK